MRTRGVSGMIRLRQCALWILVAAVTLSALPVSACVLSLRTMHVRSCCHKMAQECSGPSTAMQGACCQIRPQQTANAPVQPYAHEETQRVVASAQPGWIISSQSSIALFGSRIGAAPPAAASRSSSILRI